MAKCNENVLLRSISGRLGNVVVQRNGVVRTKPKPAKRKPSQKQEEHHHRFVLAREYAREVVADPGRSEPYKAILVRLKRKRKLNIGVYQLAIRDYMNPPVVFGALLDHDGGDSRYTVVVETNDIYGIARVEVTFSAPGGQRRETGEAEVMLYGLTYRYVIRDISLVLPGTKCSIRAFGIPGSAMEKDFVCSKGLSVRMK